MLSYRQQKDATRRSLYYSAIAKTTYEWRKRRGLCVKCGQENDRFPLSLSWSLCRGAIEAPACAVPGCFRIGKFPTERGRVCGYHVPGLHMTPAIRALAVSTRLKRALTGEPFTETDIRLLQGLADHGVKQVSAELGYSNNAVYSRLKLLYRHAGVGTLPQLMAYVLRRGLIQ